jgi:glycopeptide antibiotics resistance protein
MRPRAELKNLLLRHPFLPAWFCAVLLFVGYSLPNQELERLQQGRVLFSDTFSDIVLHVLVFMFFTLVLGFCSLISVKSDAVVLNVLVPAFTYGVIMELWQAVLPYRACRIDDLVYNTAGVLGGFVLLLIIRKRKKSVKVRMSDNQNE